MNPADTLPFAIVELIAAAMAGVIMVAVWRRRPSPGAAAFAVVMGGACWWCAWHAVSLLVTTIEAKVALAYVWQPATVLIPAAVLRFNLQYEQQVPTWPLRRTLLFFVPQMVTCLFLWTNPLHGLMFSNPHLVAGPPFPRFSVDLGSAAFAAQAVTYIYLLLAHANIARQFLRSRGQYRRQIAYMWIGLGLPSIMNALFVTGHSPIPHFNLSAAGAAAGCCFVAWAVFSQRLLQLIPIAQQTVIEGIPDAVFVVDEQRRLIYLNRAAQDFGKLAGSDHTGKGLPALVPELARLIPEPLKAEFVGELQRGIGLQMSTYVIRASRLVDVYGRHQGSIITVRDETDSLKVNELQRSRHRILAAEENVRRQIAEMLHGPIQAKMLAAWIKLGEVHSRYQEGMPAELDRTLTEVQGELDRLREEDLRRASHLLHPPLIRVGLVPALDYLAGGFEERLVINVVADQSARRADAIGRHGIPEQVRLVAYRVVEEALNNIVKHAQATRVDVAISAATGRCLITIADDGQGFDTKRVKPGFGFNGIAGRVEQIGGTWAISSERQGGTRLELSLPLRLPTAAPLEAQPVFEIEHLADDATAAGAAQLDLDARLLKR